MNIDWTPQLPASFDIVHVVLSLMAIVFLFLCFIIRRPLSSGSDLPEAKVSQDQENSSAINQSTADQTVVDFDGQNRVPGGFKEEHPDAALQLLALLQKEARLIDFTKEDVTGFSDEEVGAAARVVHEGAKNAIEKYFTLTPIRTEVEETTVQIEKGFDPQEVRLTGNLVGEAPYKGLLLHRGWRVEEVNLPRIVEGHNTKVIAPAEVEL